MGDEDDEDDEEDDDDDDEDDDDDDDDRDDDGDDDGDDDDDDDDERAGRHEGFFPRPGATDDGLYCPLRLRKKSYARSLAKKELFATLGIRTMMWSSRSPPRIRGFTCLRPSVTTASTRYLKG